MRLNRRGLNTHGLIARRLGSTGRRCSYWLVMQCHAVSLTYVAYRCLGDAFCRTSSNGSRAAGLAHAFRVRTRVRRFLCCKASVGMVIRPHHGAAYENPGFRVPSLARGRGRYSLPKTRSVRQSLGRSYCKGEISSRRGFVMWLRSEGSRDHHSSRYSLGLVPHR